MIKIFAESIH